MSGIIGLFSLSALSWIWFVPAMVALAARHSGDLPAESEGFFRFMQQLAPYAPLFSLCGIFGIVTAVGLAVRRPWGWWCGVVWLVLLVCWQAVKVAALGLPNPPSAFVLTVAPPVLIAWGLITCRQLFFPPKPEGEE